MKNTALGHRIKLEAQKSKGDKGFIANAVNAALIKLGLADEIEAEHEFEGETGTILVSTESIEIGSAVFIKTDDGRSVLTDGDHKLKDGTIITVKAGLIEATKKADQKEPAKEPAKEPVDEAVLMAAVNKIIELSDNKSKAEIEAMKKTVAVELKKLPKVSPLGGDGSQSQPKIITLSRHELSQMTLKERSHAIGLNRMDFVGEKPKSRRQMLASGEPTITSTYAGEFAAPYIAAALLSGDTISRNLITVKENVGLAGVVVKTVAFSNIVQAAGCDFSHQGGVALAERKLTPIDLKVNLELCKAPYLADWQALTMGAGRSGRQLPPDFESFMYLEVAAQVAAWVESKIWSGAAGAGSFAGFDTLLTGQAVTSSVGGATTPANVISKFREAIDNIPQAKRFDPNLKIYSPGNMIQAYVQKLGDQGFMNEYQAGVKPLNIDGYQIEYCPGKTADTLTISTMDNLWFGTDLVSDHSMVRLIDMEETDGSDNVRVVMKFTAGCQFGIGADIVQWENV